jgi:adenosylhomocysteine nucleosidase
MSFELLTVADRSILFVMAVDAEYGPHLKARFRPLMTGVGPVEAAIAVTRTLTRLEAEGRLPHLVVCLGSAGSRELEQTAVYQASSVGYRDMDASPLGFEKGRTPFLDLPAAVPLPHAIPGIPAARLSTGGHIVSGSAYDAIEAEMVDMETFSVLRAAHGFGVPLIGLRGISDGKEELRHVGDWTEYLHVIDEKLADAIDRLAQALISGDLAL